MENSIEEDIKILEEFKTNGYHILLMKYGDRIKTNFKLAKALEHILLDYKRILKENEILKKEKEQAWEEWNNLEQGSYETEQKLKQQMKELQKELKQKDKQIEQYQNMLATNDMLHILECDEKDKIIDLMANHIATSDSDLCEYLDITTKCKYYAGDNGKTCDNCIKQYFENKAKEIK